MEANQLRRTWAALAVISVGFILAFIGLFVSWWSVSFEAGGTEEPLFHARPYVGEEETELQDGGLDVSMDGQVLTVGLLATFGLAGTATAAGLLIAALFVPALRPAFAHIAGGAAIFLGLLAVVLPIFLWPAAWDSEIREADDDVPHASWWGTDDLGGASLHYTAGPGWYFTIFGMVVAPACAAGAQFLASRSYEPPTAWLPPPPPPPPLPGVQPAKAPPPPSAAGPRRLQVVQRSRSVALPKPPPSSPQPPAAKTRKRKP